MKLDFFPYQGLGSIKFGMTDKEICDVFGVMTLNDLDSEGLEYFGIDDSIGCCSLIEVFTPLEVIFSGMDLLRTPIGDIREWLNENDSNAIFCFDSIISLKYGFNIYTEQLLDDESALPEAIRFFQKDFYTEDIIANFFKEQERFFEVESSDD